MSVTWHTDKALINVAYLMYKKENGVENLSVVTVMNVLACDNTD